MALIDFVREFLKHVDKVGIYDEYDRESNKMKTSQPVLALIEMARECMPKRLEGPVSAQLMRDLDPAMRDSLIAANEDRNIIDMRAEFARRIAENGGARGILAQLVEALNEGDNETADLLLLDAKGIIKGPENVRTDLSNS